MGERDPDKGAQLIHARTRNAEYEAFAAWIKACCSNSALRAFPSAPADDLSRADRPDAVIRHARKDRLLDSFVRNVYIDKAQRVKQDPTVLLNDRQSDGEAVVEAQWGEGFPAAEVVRGKSFR